MTNLAIAANGLRKSYGDKVVLDGVDLAVPEGTIFSLLGPNGAGKTTAVKILSTLISADPGTGDIHVGGHDLAADPQAVRAAIGVTGQFSAVDGLITGEENMLLMADLHHLSKREGRRVAAELLERFDLVEAAKKPASTYSGGMKRRLDIAMTLVGNPRIIFLDEPTTGLDPRCRHNMWQIIRELVADGVTVFLTTQYLEEADELADRIAVLNDGKIAAEGTAEELKRLIPGGHVRLRFTDPAAYRSAAFALREVTRDDEALALQIPSDGSQRELRSILDRLDSAGIEADELTVHTPDLDDVFFALTGRAPASPRPAQGGRPMSSLSLAVRDSSTMLRRNLLHARRYPSLTLNLLLTPIMLLLLFVYIFGDTMSAGIGGGGRTAPTYIAYVVPGMLLMTIGSTVIGTAVSVSNDMTEGIIARFRTMAIHRGFGARRARRRQRAAVDHERGPRRRRRRGHRLPVHGRHRPGVAGGVRAARAVRPGAHLDRGRHGPGQPERRGRQQQRDAADPAAAHLQRLHPGRLHAGLVPADRRVPALHARHRDPARPAARHRDRPQRVARRRLVPGPRGARLLLVDLDSSTATRSNRHDSAGRLPQLVPPQGGVLRHRVGVRRPVGLAKSLHGRIRGQGHRGWVETSVTLVVPLAVADRPDRPPVHRAASERLAGFS